MLVFYLSMLDDQPQRDRFETCTATIAAFCTTRPLRLPKTGNWLRTLCMKPFCI